MTIDPATAAALGIAERLDTDTVNRLVSDLIPGPVRVPAPAIIALAAVAYSRCDGVTVADAMRSVDMLYKVTRADADEIDLTTLPDWARLILAARFH